MLYIIIIYEKLYMTSCIWDYKELGVGAGTRGGAKLVLVEWTITTSQHNNVIRKSSSS